MLKSKIMKTNRKLKNLTISAIVLVLIISSVAYWQKVQSEKNTSQKEIIEYKRTLFQSFECQYSCESIEVNTDAGIASVPNPECIKSCIGIAKSNPPKFDIREANLTDDLFLFQIDEARNFCFSQNADSLQGINQTEAFRCMKGALEKIKVNYEYLRDFAAL